MYSRVDTRQLELRLIVNIRKTTLTKSLTDTLVVSHDGKKYPFKVPHLMVDTFDSSAALINLINEKIVAYKERFGQYPKTIVFDSISKIFDTLLDVCNKSTLVSKFTANSIAKFTNSQNTFKTLLLHQI